MLTKRIIPCLDIRGGMVVKGVNFKGVKEIGDPVELAERYNDEGADELVFYDITASSEGRKLFCDVLERVARSVFIPLSVGGGVSSLEDFSRALGSGADKVSVNSAAIEDPTLIERAANKFGSQCVVLSMDVKRVNGKFRLFGKGGRVDTGLDALAFAKRGCELGAGEVVLNSIDTDGVRRGFDIPMLQAFSKVVKVPLIASGGAGKKEDFLELFEKVPFVDAGLAAGIFHTGLVSIQEVKDVLKKNGLSVRIL